MMRTERASPDDERLRSAPITIVVRKDEGGVADDDDDASSLSSLSTDEEPQAASPEESPRSLFSNYWTKQGKAPPRKQIPPRSPSPHCVIRTPDPYEHFGLVEDEEEEEEYSTNTYERMINYYDVKPKKSSSRRRPYESRPIWDSWFSGSAPCLSSKRSGGLLASMTAGFQSEPMLRKKQLPPVLRKGRFGKTKGTSNSSTNATASSANRKVRFESKIQIKSYQPPVESWAADGWSSWFGV